jgi:NAD(P)-dependent dehydrogenase (short-subunit alcohol dehydrogenase family)
MNLYLEDKIALVTGSTAGIGFAIAAGLAAEGARVIVNGRSEERVRDAVAAILKQHPKAKLESLRADLATAEGAERTASLFPAKRTATFTLEWGLRSFCESSSKERQISHFL